MQKLLFPLLFIFIILAGCTSNQTDDSASDENTDITKLSTNVSAKQEVSNRTKDILKKEDAITSIAAVNTEKKLVVGVDVKQKSRFHLKSLRKEWTKRLEKAFPKKDVEVTTDQKIIWELSELEKNLQNKALSKKKVEKEVKRITKLMKDTA